MIFYNVLDKDKLLVFYQAFHFWSTVHFIYSMRIVFYSSVLAYHLEFRSMYEVCEGSGGQSNKYPC